MGSNILDVEMERNARVISYGNPRPRWERIKVRVKSPSL
jgi:hypothetical protein